MGEWGTMSSTGCIENTCPCAVVCDCSEGGCTVKIDVENHVILKGEKICRDQKICDHIVFTENNNILVFVVEFKSRNVDAHDIEEKFFNCWEKAKEILESARIFKYAFYYIIIAKSWRSIERKRISKIKLPSSGKREIIVRKTGVSISSIISEFPPR